MTTLEAQYAQLVSAGAAVALLNPPPVSVNLAPTALTAVVIPPPPAPALQLVKKEKQSSSTKYVKRKNRQPALNESQLRGQDELRGFYNNPVISRKFMVTDFRDFGYAAPSVDQSTRFLISKGYTESDAAAVASRQADLVDEGLNVGMKYRDARKEDSALLKPALVSLVGHSLPAVESNGQITKANLEGSPVFQGILKVFREAPGDRSCHNVTRHMVAYGFVRFDELKVRPIQYTI